MFDSTPVVTDIPSPISTLICGNGNDFMSLVLPSTVLLKGGFFPFSKPSLNAPPPGQPPPEGHAALSSQFPQNVSLSRLHRVVSTSKDSYVVGYLLHLTRAYTLRIVRL